MADPKPKKADHVPPQLTAFPVVAIDPADGRKKLSASACAGCGKLTFPPAPLCSHCGSENVAPAPLSEHGSLYTYSVLHVGARGWPAPYVLGYVDLPEGVRVFSHIDGAPEALRIDMPVSLQIRTPIKNPEDQDVLAFTFGPSNTSG
jgi:benzoylsuccinyl-CoA thiolase BbsA subunit